MYKIYISWDMNISGTSFTTFIQNYALLFISNTSVSNSRVKLAKIKQVLSNTLRLNLHYFKIIHILHPRYHKKKIVHILKKSKRSMSVLFIIIIIIVVIINDYCCCCCCFFCSQKELGLTKSSLQFFWKKL